ncbi:hypothetical protein [Rhizobium laguerreae]|nr:hypothetical protein [Rhizobium laguerreae]
MRRVLDREKDLTDEIIRRKIREAIDDPGSISMPIRFSSGSNACMPSV